MFLNKKIHLLGHGFGLKINIILINKLTWVNISDSSGVKWLNVFHLYGGFFKKSSKISSYVKGSSKIVNPPRVEYRGYKLRQIKKGVVLKSFIVKVKKQIRRNDFSYLNYSYNSVVLIKKKNTTMSKYLLGLALTDLKRKKYIYLFKKRL